MTAPTHSVAVSTIAGPAGFGTAPFGTSPLGGWVTTVSATLAGNGISTATLANDGVRGAVVTEVLGLASVQV